MRRRALTLGAAAVLVAIVLVLWCLTIPAIVPAAALPPHAPDVANGRTMFDIGGCASCHATPADDPEKVDRTKLGGGLPLEIAVRHVLRAEYFARSGRRHRRLERSRLRHRADERHLAARPPSVSGLSLHLL